MKIKDYKADLEKAIEVFGDLRNNYCIYSDYADLSEGDTVYLVNSNCEFEYDNGAGGFWDNLAFEYDVELDFVKADYSEYVPDKSNNGGCYAYCECEIKKIKNRRVLDYSMVFD